jgi:hypothetical protein
MVRIRKALIAGAVAGLALTGLAGPAVAGISNPNNPGYYGEDCTKVEYVDGTTSYIVQPGDTVYIKTGTVITPYTNTTTEPVTLYFDKDISFVITCPGEPPTS